LTKAKSPTYGCKYETLGDSPDQVGKIAKYFGPKGIIKLQMIIEKLKAFYFRLELI
jgi:hypothetical protein